jgi:putative transposase
MHTYRKGAHTVYDIKYHIVWATKYRYKVLKGDIALRARELIRQTCASLEVYIVKGYVSKDHIHLFVSVPPDISAAKLIQSLKGRSSRKLQMEFPELGKRFWGKHIWSRGYFCVSSGNVTDDMIKAYIESQEEHHKVTDFKVEDESEDDV